MKTSHITTWGSTSLMATILLLSSCSATASHKSDPPAEASKSPTNPLEVNISDSLLKQIKIGTPSVEPVSKTMRAAARIQADATRMARVGSPVDGRITKLFAMEGQHVRRGEVIADIHSNQLSTAEFAFLKA